MGSKATVAAAGSSITWTSSMTEMVALTTFFVKTDPGFFLRNSRGRWRAAVAAMSANSVRSSDPMRAPARRGSVSSTEVSENRILGSNAFPHSQQVAVEMREAIRTTSMMDDCNARALTPLRKSSIAVLSSRLFRKRKSRH